VGAGFSTKQPWVRDTHGAMSLTPVWRIGHAKQGWKYKYGTNWYSTQLDRVIGETPSDLGKLTVRPLLGGYGYTRLIGRRTSVAANLLGGYAFTSFSLNGTAGDRYRNSLGVAKVEADAANTFVLKPEVSTWIDLSPKIGLNISTGYMVARPHVILRTPAGQDKRRVNADMMMIKVGIVYSIF